MVPFVSNNWSFKNEYLDISDEGTVIKAKFAKGNSRVPQGSAKVYNHVEAHTTPSPFSFLFCRIICGGDGCAGVLFWTTCLFICFYEVVGERELWVGGWLGGAWNIWHCHCPVAHPPPRQCAVLERPWYDSPPSCWSLGNGELFCSSSFVRCAAGSNSGVFHWSRAHPPHTLVGRQAPRLFSSWSQTCTQRNPIHVSLSPRINPTGTVSWYIKIHNHVQSTPPPPFSLLYSFILTN